MPDWPQNRDFPFEDSAAPVGLSAAWDFSARRIHQLRNAIEDVQLPASVACIGISGSLARMEAHRASDVDLLIVIDDRNQQAFDDADGVYSLVWDALDSGCDDTGLVRPKPGGVFSCCARWTQLTDQSARGVVNEDMTTYGQRMQLLIDCQPLYQDATFESLQNSLLDWYTESRICNLFNESGPYHWLWQEVQRYWRSIRARACWLHEDDQAKALEVNVKLRSSRLLLIVTFLIAIENAHRQPDSSRGLNHSLLSMLKQTPLERVQGNLPGASFREFSEAYDEVLQFCAIRPQQEILTPEVLQALNCLRQNIAALKKRQPEDWFA